MARISRSVPGWNAGHGPPGDRWDMPRGGAPMSGLDVPRILDYGFAGFGYLLAAFTCYLLVRIYKQPNPSRNVVWTICAFMAFSIALCVFNAFDQRKELKLSREELGDLRAKCDKERGES